MTEQFTIIHYFDRLEEAEANSPTHLFSPICRAAKTFAADATTARLAVWNDPLAGHFALGASRASLFQRLQSAWLRSARMSISCNGSAGAFRPLN